MCVGWYTNNDYAGVGFRGCRVIAPDSRAAWRTWPPPPARGSSGGTRTVGSRPPPGLFLLLTRAGGRGVEVLRGDELGAEAAQLDAAVQSLRALVLGSLSLRSAFLSPNSLFLASTPFQLHRPVGFSTENHSSHNAHVFFCEVTVNVGRTFSIHGPGSSFPPDAARVRTKADHASGRTPTEGNRRRRERRGPPGFGTEPAFGTRAVCRGRATSLEERGGDRAGAASEANCDDARGRGESRGATVEVNFLASVCQNLRSSLLSAPRQGARTAARPGRGPRSRASRCRADARAPTRGAVD